MPDCHLCACLECFGCVCINIFLVLLVESYKAGFCIVTSWSSKSAFTAKGDKGSGAGVSGILHGICVATDSFQDLLQFLTERMTSPQQSAASVLSFDPQPLCKAWASFFCKSHYVISIQSLWRFAVSTPTARADLFRVRA